MKTALFSILCSVSFAIAGEVAMTDHPLPDVKASLQIPEGWTSTTESEDGVYVYHFSKGSADASTSITLSVTTKVPDRTGQTPGEYAAALIDMSKDEGVTSNVLTGDFKGLKSLRSEYDFESDAGKMRAVNIALSNDKSGTLYFFAWQSPLNESAEFEAIREKILSSAQFDPSF
ncbi:MAG: hypothetical protein ACOYNN_03835 [Terrimicrobiaceae bacterium]|jgi:hypothetical protein